jgi:hypothetical protein
MELRYIGQHCLNCQARSWMSEGSGSVSISGKRPSLLHRFQTGSENHPDSYPSGTEVKRQRSKDGHSPPSSTEVTSTQPYVFVEWLLIKPRVNFTFYLPLSAFRNLALFGPLFLFIAQWISGCQHPLVCEPGSYSLDNSLHLYTPGLHLLSYGSSSRQLFRGKKIVHRPVSRKGCVLANMSL